MHVTVMTLQVQTLLCQHRRRTQPTAACDTHLLLCCSGTATAVYAVGMYVNASGAKKALHKYRGTSVDGLMANQKAFDGGRAAAEQQ